MIHPFRIYELAPSHRELLRWQAADAAYYARSSHEYVEELERRVAQLEGARGAVACASGMAALSVVLACVRWTRQSRIWVHEGIFPGTHELAWYWSHLVGCRFKSVGSPIEEFAGMTTGSKNVVLLQTPLSDTLESFDLGAVIKQMRGYDSDALIVVDNSIMTPKYARPLDDGADVSWHSLSKYLSGHGTTLAGVVLSNNVEFLRLWRHDARFLLGNIVAQRVALEVLEGLKTFDVRMEHITASAKTVMSYLLSQRVDLGRGQVTQIHYPRVAGLMAFQCPDAEYVVNSLRVFEQTVHWGSTSSAACYDESVDRVRLSVGLEPPEILIDDLKQAFARNFLTA